MLRWKRVEISGGFLLLMAALFYLDESDLLLWALAACAVHELGHFLAIRLLGGRVILLRLTCVGAEMRLSDRYPMGPLRQAGSALAGPAVNLLLAFAAARLAPRMGEPLYVFAGLNLTLGLFNLLPAVQLDGGRVLRQLLRLANPEGQAEAAAGLVSAALGALLLAGGGVLALKGRANPTLLLAGAWLLASSLPKGRKNETFF